MVPHDTYGKNQYSTYGQMKVGFGVKPAVLVVDFQLAFTSLTFEMGGAPLIDRAVKNTQRLLEVARSAHIPVAKCVMGYGNKRGATLLKVSSCQDLIIGSPAVK